MKADRIEVEALKKLGWTDQEMPGRNEALMTLIDLWDNGFEVGYNAGRLEGRGE